jgi:hypothetical protein
VNLPLAAEADATTMTDNTVAPPVVTTVEPVRAACTTCHDSLLVDIHAVLNTDAGSGTETCEICHGEGKEAAVSAVHKLAPL